MNLIEPKVIPWGLTPHNKLETIEWIERAGRKCYKSEDKIIKGSGKIFVQNVINNKHYSVIEHSNLVIRTKDTFIFPIQKYEELFVYFDSPYFKMDIHHDRVYISGNWRAWLEWSSKEGIEHSFDKFPLSILDNNYRFEIVDNYDIPDSLKMVTIEYITNRAVTHELVRHRPASYSQESQRYVRYGDIDFIKPFWYDGSDMIQKDIFYASCLSCEKSYSRLIESGYSPQKARVVLPNATSTNIVMTAYIDEWKHVCKLRCDKTADPSMREIMLPTKKYLDTLDENILVS